MDTVSIWTLVLVAGAIAVLTILLRSLVMPSSYAKREQERKELRKKIQEREEKNGEPETAVDEPTQP